MEIAVEKNNFEVLIILAGFAEVPPEMKLDFLGMILEHKEGEQYTAEFKKNLEGLSVSEVVEGDFQVVKHPDQVLEKQLKLHWQLAPDHQISVNLLQFAAARGKTHLLQHLLDHG